MVKEPKPVTYEQKISVVEEAVIIIAVAISAVICSAAILWVFFAFEDYLNTLNAG